MYTIGWSGQMIHKVLTSRISLIMLVLILCAAVMPAQETDFLDPFVEDPFLDDPFLDDPASDDIASFDDSSFDDLFFEDVGITEVTESDADRDPLADLLETEAITWSGNYSGNLGFSWEWDEYLTGFTLSDHTSTLSPSASATLRFDARPEQDYRVFGKLILETQASGLGGLGLDLSQIQFSDNGDGTFNFSVDDTDEESEDQQDPPSLSLTIGMQELFADFQYEDSVFFRFGKSFIAWGVGYFFSPADVLNLDSIDAEDPTADRQGPLNLRVHYPFGLNNLYVYAITDQVESPEDIAYAVKSEWLLGGTEVGIGGYYRQNKAPRLVSTFSTSVKDVRVFGEGVVSWGSDRVFLTPSIGQPTFEDQTPASERYVALDSFTIDTLPFFSGTIGFSYTATDPAVFLAGQYYLNGEGYPFRRFEDGSTLLDNAVYLALNPDTNGLSVPADQQPDDYDAPPAVGIADIQNFGQHYGALIASFSSIADTDLSCSVFWLGNLTDGSGIISPSLSWNIFDHASVSFGTRFTYGASGTEYGDTASLFAHDPEEEPQRPIFAVQVDLSLGGGSF